MGEEKKGEIFLRPFSFARFFFAQWGFGGQVVIALAFHL
jgi:hypothetical protein